MRQLRASGLRVEVDQRSEKIGAKIRHAQLQKIPFMIVLGDRERDENRIAVRERVRGDIGTMTVDEFQQMARDRVTRRALVNVEGVNSGAGAEL